jgi:hypothetical protein
VITLLLPVMLTPSPVELFPVMFMIWLFPDILMPSPVDEFPRQSVMFVFEATMRRASFELECASHVVKLFVAALIPIPNPEVSAMPTALV